MKYINISISLLLFLLCALTNHSLKADHILGSDIRWECLGNDSFYITVTVYRDCGGSALTTGGISVTSLCGNMSYNAGGAIGISKDITPVCESACTRCETPGCTDTRFGIHQAEVTGYVKLDRTKCCVWKVSWGQCCRSAVITTGAVSENFYIEGEMDICLAQCNNSPYFTIPPVAVFCMDRCIIYNPAVHDKDVYNGEGDSLVYKFVRPLKSAGSPIPYSPGYDFDEPLSYAGDPDKDAPWSSDCEGFHLDSLTGELRFKATQEEQTVMVIAVEEWRKDSAGTPKKISEIRRDMHIAITECDTNKPPVIVSETYTYTFCAGQSRCITMNTFDLDKSDTATLSWDDQVPGASFTVETGKKWPRGTFCWKPGSSDIRSLPYQFVTRVKDNVCPYPGIADRTFRIYVKPAPTANYSVKVVACNVVAFSATETGNVPIVKYLWEGETPLGEAPLWYTGQKFNYVYSEPGTYKYSLTVTSADSCKTVYEDSIEIKSLVKVSLPPDMEVCRNSLLDIPATIKYGRAPFHYRWMANGLVLDSGNIPVLKNLLIDRDTVIVVRVIDSLNCGSVDSIHIQIKNTTRNILGPDRGICHGDTITLNSGIYGPNVSYEWYSDVSGTFTLVGTTSAIQVTEPATYVLNVSDTPNCSGTDTIRIAREPNSEFTYDSLGIRQFRFIPENTTAASYLWHFGDGDSSTLISPVHTWAKDSTYTVTLTVTSQAGCTAASSQTYIIAHTATSILSKGNNTSWKVYPNPIKDDRLIIEAGGPSNGRPYDLMLYDISGRKVAEKLKVNDRKTVLELPEDLKPGNYLLHIQAGEVYTTEILVK